MQMKRTARYTIKAVSTWDDKRRVGTCGRYRYQDKPGATDRQFAVPYSRFCELCRVLAADGFEYTVTLTADADGNPRFLVAGTADRILASKPAARKRSVSLPAPKPAEYCRKMWESATTIEDVEYWRELEVLAMARRSA